MYSYNKNVALECVHEGVADVVAGGVWLGAAGLRRDRVAVQALGGNAVALLVAAQSARKSEERS